ncbi:MAG: hypothetical protein ACETVX_06090 [bacterium]
MNTVIAVLSTIILAVTVLTLFLGIFAYIVYKARKRSSRRKPKPEKFAEKPKPAEIVKEPEPIVEIKPEVPPQPPISVERPQTSGLIRRYEPEKKKEKRVEWR